MRSVEYEDSGTQDERMFSYEQFILKSCRGFRRILVRNAKFESCSQRHRQPGVNFV